MSRTVLVVAAAVFIVAMFAIVPWLTRSLGPSIEYLSVFCIYWFGFCLPLGLMFQGRANAKANLSLNVGGHTWVPWAIAAQVCVVAVASLSMLSGPVAAVAILIAVVCGLINGFSEEFFWRGAFLEQGRGVFWFQALGVGLFTLWHVPLAQAHGVTYEGGPLALVGGALGMGIFWSVVANKTGRIGWPVIGHVLANMAAFVGLIATNFIPPT